MISMMITEALDVDDPKVEQYPPTPLNGKWGFAEVNQSWIGPPDGILPLSSSSSTEPGVQMAFYTHHFQMTPFSLFICHFPPLQTFGSYRICIPFNKCQMCVIECFKT